MKRALAAIIVGFCVITACISCGAALWVAFGALGDRLGTGTLETALYVVAGTVACWIVGELMGRLDEFGGGR